MEPHYYELLDLLTPIKILKQNFKIIDHQYKCGYISIPHKYIVLNKKNSFKGNIETISHELMHLYYHNQNIDLSENQIEQLGMNYLKRFPEYYEGLENKLGELKLQ